MTDIEFELSPEDSILVNAIISRARSMAADRGVKIDSLSLHMDVSACHLNGCPLKLKELLEAPDFDFVHDVLGIRDHIDRETGKLTRCFFPRFAAPEEQPQ